MTEANTHASIDPSLCGEIVALGPGQARVALSTDARMAADPRGLVHGGFVFGAADYAAMLAVNDPNVVLGSAQITFTAPVRVGETVHVDAKILTEKGRKREVEVEASVGATRVIQATFTCFVLDQHVFDR